MATILPPLTVKPPTENSSPSRLVTNPTAPLINANSMARPSREYATAWRAIASAPRDLARPSGRTEVGSQHRVRVEYGDQSVEVPVSPGCEEGLDDLALSLRIGFGEHEREPLGRTQRLEHDEQGEHHRVGQQRLVLGVRPVDRVDDRFRHAHRVERLLASRPA